MVPNTPLKELYRLWRYIQYLLLESDYDCNDDEFDNPLNEDNWLLQQKENLRNLLIIIHQMLQNQVNLPVKSW